MHAKKRKVLLSFTFTTLLAIAAWSTSSLSPNYWQKVSLPYSRLEESAALCSSSVEEKIGCLRALRSLLENALPHEHLLLQKNQLSFAPGVMSDAEEMVLEKTISTQSLQIPFTELFQTTKKKLPQATDSEIVASAFNAWLSALDPHSTIKPAELAKEQSANSEEELDGLAAHVHRYEDSLYVSNVIPGSAAEQSGLLAGDKIIAINGVPLRALSTKSRSDSLRNANDKKENLQLEILRGHRRFSLTTQKEHFLLKNVSYHFLKSAHDHNFGYIQVRAFSKVSTCGEVGAAIEHFESSGVRGIVLDLQDNPGGFVQEAICVSGLFMGPNIMVASFQHVPEMQKDPMPTKALDATYTEQKHYSLYTKEKQLTKLPLLVLVNQNTASAAEILAGALQDNHRARIMGRKTFGKGTMQSVFTAWNDKDIRLLKTTHEVIRPSGIGLQRVGITPDQNFASDKTHYLREGDFYQNALPQYGVLRAASLKISHCDTCQGGEILAK